MLILLKEGVITPKQDKTNITLPFSVSKGTEKLIIKYEYNPKIIEDEALSGKYLENGRKKYNTDFNFDDFKEVKNLITLSFDECGKYRGACHRQPNTQKIIIAESGSTYGVENRKLEPGEWDVMLNCHFVGCDVNYKIEVEGE